MCINDIQSVVKKPKKNTYIKSKAEHVEENKLNRDFNDIESVKAFIENHKYKNFYNNEHNNDLSIGTVEDFANKNRHGTYIVYCSNSIKQDTSKSFHLVAIINGDIYDTWDSSNYYVLGAWAVNTSATKLINKVNSQNS